MTDEEMRERITARLAFLKRSPITAAGIGGLERSYIRDFLSGRKQSVKPSTYEKIAKGLDWTISDLTGSASDAAAPPRETSPQLIPGELLVGGRDLPVYAAAQGGSGHLIVTTDPIRYVRRPAILDGVRNAYALLVVGQSMIPAFRPNDMALVDPTLQPETDTDVILYDHDPVTGEAEAIIKHLTGWTERLWKLEQYRPSKVFTEHRADWPICHRVVGKYSRR